MSGFFTRIALDAAPSTTPSGGAGGLIVTIVIYGGIIALMYFLLIHPQRKKSKEEKKMRENLQVGDEIVTIGGIYGRVISLKEDTMVLESLSDHSKLTIARWAIQTNNTAEDRLQAERAAQAAAKEAEKAEKKGRRSKKTDEE